MKKILLFKDADRASTWIAKYFDKFIQEKPDAVLGFATGVTPLLTYSLLQKYCKEGTSWENIKSFNLDEFVGVPVEHPESFRSQMENNLFVGVNIKKENIFIPNGLAKDLDAEAKKYESLINEAGGIDLQYISIGANGHMAYDEPGTPADSLTHVTDIAPFTRNILIDQKKFDSLEETPTQAITVGIQTIMNFKEVVMVATGANKADPVKKMLEGPVTTDVPSSFLQNHDKVTFIIDEPSAELLDIDKHDDLVDMRD